MTPNLAARLAAKLRRDNELASHRTRPEAEAAVSTKFASAECVAGRHWPIVTYHRSWWRAWRKKTYMRCWECDIRQPWQRDQLVPRHWPQEPT